MSLQRYLEQLHADIAFATANVSVPWSDKPVEIWEWISQEEEEKHAPTRNLQDWTGIKAEMLPPEKMLTDEQVHDLLEALKKMLNDYNWCFVMQITVPERVQYETIRQNFDQEAKVQRWHHGFFEFCKPDTEYEACVMGEYCHCKFFEEFFSGFDWVEQTPEEERASILRIEIDYLQKKYGEDWEKYYPYHLDPEYDDEDGNPYDYGIGDGDYEEDDEDDWWRN